MAVVRRRGSRFELRVKHRLLPRVFTATFDDEDGARAYGLQLEALLARGVVPQELLAPRSSVGVPTLGALIRNYLNTQPASALDVDVLELLFDQVGAVRVTDVTYRWCEEWLHQLKVQHNLAPGTIRKRVGALARMLDWHFRRTAEAGGTALANPLRLLPRGYASYTDHDRAALQVAAAAGQVDGRRLKAPKRDQERDRRLAPDEEARIVAALSGQKRPDRERALQLPHGSALLDLFHLVVATGLRLREAYRLRVRDVDLPQRTIRVLQSKTDTARDVPIVRAIFPMLESRVAAAQASGGPATPVFPWWTGADDPEELKRVTSYLSRAFARAFEYAGCQDLTEHDLRHEATCRWILMRDAQGQWLFRESEVMRITGHRDPRMFQRYVSLRGSDLAARLW